MPKRDVGDIISPNQPRGRWERGEGLQVRIPDLAWMLAWVDAVLTHGDSASGMALFETRWLRILAFAEGRVSLQASPVPVEVDSDLRRELLGPDVEDLVLGYTERSGEWVPGYAGLLQLEAEAFRCSLEARSSDCHQPDREHRGGMRCVVEVRNLIDRRRGRRGMPLSIETVETRLYRARSKLRAWAESLLQP